MRLSDIVSLGSRYLVLGIIAMAIVVMIYRVFLRKRDIHARKVFIWAIFICYITVVLGVTLMRRGGVYSDMKVMPLFYSYKEAWVDFSSVTWRNIILNILMFVPLGFLLPMCRRMFDSLWKIILVSFGVTAFISRCIIFTV